MAELEGPQPSQPAADSPAQVVRGPDLEVVEEAIAGLRLAAARLTAAPGAVDVTVLPLGSLSLVIGSFDFPVATFGEVQPGMLTIGLPLTPGDGTWNGVALDPRSLWTYRADGGHEGHARHPPTFAALSIPCTLAGHAADSPAVSVTTCDEVATLGRLLQRAESAAREGTLSPEAIPALEREVHEALDEALFGSPPEEPHLTASAYLVRSCIDVADGIGPNPRVQVLSEALDVSDRWIRAAFHKEFGVSPSAFFRARNLHLAHRDLRRARRGDTSVTDVAMRRGFWHLGRFSGLYRRFFGELPSETLDRQAL